MKIIPWLINVEYCDYISKSEMKSSAIHIEYATNWDDPFTIDILSYMYINIKCYTITSDWQRHHCIITSSTNLIPYKYRILIVSHNTAIYLDSQDTEHGTAIASVLDTN